MKMISQRSQLSRLPKAMRYERSADTPVRCFMVRSPKGAKQQSEGQTGEAREGLRWRSQRSPGKPHHITHTAKAPKGRDNGPANHQHPSQALNDSHFRDS